MKKLLLGLMMLFAFGAFAQSTHTIDFETPGVGADWAWAVAENLDNPPLEFVANPAIGGINTSATVAKFTARLAGNPWALCFTSDDGVFTFDATNSTITIMVYKSVISNVGFKVEGTGTPTELVTSNTLIDTWEELTFDFSAVIGQSYNKLVIIPDYDFTPRSQENIVYFDNINAPDGVVAPPPAGPTSNAIDPPARDPGDVISIYSDFYSDISGINYNPWWGQSGTVDPIFDIGSGNFILAYNNFNYQGTDFAGNSQNASLMEYLHVDLWTDDATVIKVSPVNAGTGAGEFLVQVPIINGEWSSVDIPIGDFTGMTWNNIIQLKFDGQAGTTPSNIYLDNIYFWKNPTVSGTDATLSDLQVDGTTLSGFTAATENYAYALVEGTVVIPQITTAIPNDPNALSVLITQATAIPGDATVVVTAEDGITTKTYTVSYAITIPNSAPAIPTASAEDVISIYSDAYINADGTNFSPFWGQSTIVTVDDIIAGNNTLKYTNLNYQGTELLPALNVSGYEYLHVDFWTGNSTDLNIFLISPGPVQTAFALPVTLANWVSVDIPLSAFSPVDLTNVFQMMVTGNGGIWFDNWYFWKSPAATTWTGSIDNNWHEAGNWSAGMPGAVTDVTIPAGLTNYPTIGSAALCNNITLEANATGYATLLDGGFLTVNGTAYVESYLTGSVWHFIGSPVTGATADVFHLSGTQPDVYLQSFDEATNVYTDYGIDLANPINVMEGYAVWVDGADWTFTYPGAMNTGTFGAADNMTRSIDGDNGGNNLLANPYPSGLDWDLVKGTNVNMMDAYYVEDNGNWATYVAGAGVGTSGVIAPGQGFFAFVSDGGAPSTGTITMDNGARVHTNTAYLKDAVSNLIRLEANGNGRTDETIVRFLEEATPLFDEQFDAFKLDATNETIPQIYSISNKNLAINSLPETNMVQLGFTAQFDGEYSISAIEINDISSAWLEDTFTGIFTNLTSDSYSFTYSTSDAADRFILHFAPLVIDDNFVDNTNIYSYEKDVYVNVSEITSGDIVIYNLMGQKVISNSMSGLLNKVTLKEAGFYIVKVSLNGQTVSKKVLIK